MKYQILTLRQLMEELSEDELTEIINRFKSISQQDGKSNDVEYFLHNKAIHLEKVGASTTYLVFDQTINLLGYFSLANKPLTMPKKYVEKLSKTQKKILKNHGYITSNGDLQIYSYLLGQIGRNFNSQHTIKGQDLLTLAYKKLQEACMIVGSKYVWLECENNEHLLNFYQDFGFKQVEGYTSPNQLKVMIMKL